MAVEDDLSLKGDGKKDRPTSEKQHPSLEANWFSRITFWWMNGFFYTAYKRPVGEKDIFEILPWAKAEENASRFEKRWTALSEEEKCKRGSLFKHLLIHFKKYIAFGLLLELVAEIGRFASPLLISGLIHYLDGTGQTSQTMAYIYAILIIISSIGLVPLHSSYFLIHTYIGMLMRTTCAAMIYKKVLTISNRARREVSTGQIVSLVSTETETFHWGMQTLHAILFTPLTFIGLVIFGGITIGYPIIIGVLFSVLFLIVRFLVGKCIGKFRRSQEEWTSKRVNLMSEIITAMKVIKMYCWEKPFSLRAKKLRRSETEQNFKRSLLMLSGLAASFHVPTYVVYLMHITSYLIGFDIRPELTVTLLGWLRAMLLTSFVIAPLAFGMLFETLGSTELIKKFLMREDLHIDLLQTAEEPSEVTVELADASATWDEEAKDNQGNLTGPTLSDINLTSEVGELIGITGKVGSGKSSLILAILGELALMKGKRQVQGSIAYVPQEPWVLSDTVRSNIIMDSDFNQVLYDRVLESCTLDVDISGFPLGDSTFVGERGLSLSGGQKARLNLARAVYANADIYLLDDPLAAVDVKVGNHIFQRCISGLLQSKLCIMATHNLHYLPMVDKVVVMENGCIVLKGKYEEISDKLLQYARKETPNITEDTMQTLTVHKNSTVGNIDQVSTEQNHEEKHLGHQQTKPSLDVKDTRGVPYQVYLNYLKAGRGHVFLGLFILFIALGQVSEVSSGWIFSQWYTSMEELGLNSTNAAGLISEKDSIWFIAVLAGLIIAMSVSSLIGTALASVFMTTAGRRLYNKMFDVVLRAPMYFYETNPVGQILNRFSRDTGFMDMLLTLPLYQSIQLAIILIALTVYACVIFPWMTLVASLFVVFSIIFMQLAHRGIRESKRIEGSFRSPTYSHLSATIQGLTVIRAFRKQGSFLEKAFTHMDRHTAAWHTYLCAQRYIGMRIDFFAATLVVVYILVSVITATPEGAKGGAGASGLAFVYLLFLLGVFQFCLTQIAEFMSIMTSVERIQQFGTLEQEAPEHTDVLPPEGWPKQGHIKLTNMALMYRDQSQAALGPLTLDIHPAEKVGVVGRTGAGKSSLFVSLLRMVEPTGSIKIDGVDVTKIGLTDLRTNISIIPQDPVLFTGSLRLNLDPFQEFADDHLWKALHQVQLSEKVSALSGGLSAEMGEAGDNFSVGEKQLLCMARALMRKNKIIIVDEATANVDYRTDQTIQKILNTEFAASTVITIAHRLNTIITYDRIMVLEAGRLVEFDHPHVLLGDSSSMFHQMVQHLGDVSYKTLCEHALISFTARQYTHKKDVRDEENLDTQSDGMAQTNLGFVE